MIFVDSVCLPKYTTFVPLLFISTKCPPCMGLVGMFFYCLFRADDIRLACVSSHGLMGSQRVKFSSLWNPRQVPFKLGLIIFRVNLPFLGTHSNELRNMNLIAEMSGAMINISHVADFFRWIHLCITLQLVWMWGNVRTHSSFFRSLPSQRCKGKVTQQTQLAITACYVNTSVNAVSNMCSCVNLKLCWHGSRSAVPSH